jgi:hypothetical protein
MRHAIEMYHEGRLALVRKGLRSRDACLCFYQPTNGDGGKHEKGPGYGKETMEVANILAWLRIAVGMQSKT